MFVTGSGSIPKSAAGVILGGPKCWQEAFPWFGGPDKARRRRKMSPAVVRCVVVERNEFRFTSLHNGLLGLTAAGRAGHLFGAAGHHHFALALAAVVDFVDQKLRAFLG